MDELLQTLNLALSSRSFRSIEFWFCFKNPRTLTESRTSVFGVINYELEAIYCYIETLV